MQLEGTLVDVVVNPIGDVLVGDHALGTDILFLDDVAPFSENGGQVTINGEVYTYATVDDETSTMVLTTGLVADAVDEDDVDAYPYAEEKLATVEVEEGQDAITAIVPSQLADHLTDEVRDQDQQETVLIEYRDEDWYVVDIYGVRPATSAEYLDPETMPAPEPVAPVAPSTSPTPSVTGMKAAIHVKWPGVSNATSVQYEVHMRLHDPLTVFAPIAGDAATMYIRTASTQAVVNSLPGGGPLDYGPDDNPQLYDFAIIAVAEDDPTLAAAPGEVATGSMDKVAVDDLVASTILTKLLTALNVEAESLEIGQAGGRQIVQNLQDGFKLIGQDGKDLVHMPLDIGEDVTLTAAVTATFLTVLNSLVVRGTDNEISGNAGLYLAAGVSDPKSPPILGSTWHRDYSLDSAVGRGCDYNGLTIYTGGFAAHCIYWPPSGGASITPYDSVVVRDGFNDLGSRQFYAQEMWIRFKGGVVWDSVNLWWYVLTWDEHDDAWYLQRYTEFGDPSSRLVVGGTIGAQPIVGYDHVSGRILVARPSNTGIVRVDQYWWSNGWASITNLAEFDFGDATGDMGFVTRCVTEYGERWILRRAAGDAGDFRVYDPAEVRRQDEEWPQFDERGDRVAGACWDGTRFRSINNSGPCAYYSENIWTSEPSLWYSVYTHYDGDAAGTGVHETGVSPESSLVLPKRKVLTVSSIEPPDSGGLDDPDVNRIYLRRSGGATHFLQGSTSSGDLDIDNAVFTNPPGTPPPAATNFPAGVPAFFRSTKTNGVRPLVEILGDGTAYFENPEFPITVLPANATGFTGQFTLIRQGTKVYMFGYCDNDTLDTGSQSGDFVETGAVIPAGWRPLSSFVTAPHAPYGSGAVQYRYRINTATTTDGKILVQRNGLNATFMTVDLVMWSTT